MIDIYGLPLFYISFKSNDDVEQHYVDRGFRNINHFEAVNGKKLNPDRFSGYMIPIWNVLQTPFECKYIYSITTEPGAVKGPYCHTIRNGIMTLVEGKAVVIYKDSDGYQEVWLLENYEQIEIPANTEYCIIGQGTGSAVLVNICDHPWQPGDDETYVPDFDDLDFTLYDCKGTLDDPTL